MLGRRRRRTMSVCQQTEHPPAHWLHLPLARSRERACDFSGRAWQVRGLKVANNAPALTDATRLESRWDLVIPGGDLATNV